MAVSTSRFESVRSIVMAKIGYESYVDQVNLCLKLARESGLSKLMDHVAIGLDYLSIDDKIVWTESIMDATYNGVTSVE